MKRTSIVAPLLLIGIGALFLARNMYPDLQLIDYLAKYWPVLLVIWGVLRLAEIVFWAATDRPLPRQGVSPGEWILVVFLCIFGVTLHTVRGFDRWWPNTRISMGGLDMFGESYEYPLGGQKAVGPNPKIVIESFRGNARITGVDGSDVKVTGRRTIRSLDQDSANRANQDSSFELAGSGNEVIVRTNQDRISGNHRVSADLEIQVPKGSTIEAHGRTGDFDITDVNGSVEITSDNAGVRLQNIGGDVRIDLRRSDIIRAGNVKGLVDLKGSHGSDIDLHDISGPVTIGGSYSGVIQLHNLMKPLHFTAGNTELSIERLPGQVRMALGNFSANDLVGPVRLSTRSRDVTISDFSNSLELSVEHGDITLRPAKLPLAKIDAHTKNGHLEIALPLNAKFDLTASTGRGEITNDFGSPLRTEDMGKGSTLRGSIPGGSVVSVQTDRGRVLVRKATAADSDVAVMQDDSPSTSRPPSTQKPPVVPKPLQRVEQ